MQAAQERMFISIEPCGEGFPFQALKDLLDCIRAVHHNGLIFDGASMRRQSIGKRMPQ